MKKILVVEDETAVRENLVELLCTEGFLPVQAKDGEEGARLAWETLPDLILCDVNMPRLDGFGMLSRVIQDPATATIPFIFLTARGEREDLRRGMSLGADDYIIKPFSIDEILRAIDTRLEKRSRTQHEAEKVRAELGKDIRNNLPEEMLTPISMIMALSDVLMKREEISSMEAGQISIVGREIHQAAGHLLRVIQNYRLVSELEALETDQNRLEALVDNQVWSSHQAISEMAEIKARQENRATDLVLNLAPAQLKISEIFLQKVAEELLDNAFKYSQTGKPVEVTGEVISEQQRYRLRVRDLGRGIPPEQVAILNGRVRMNNSAFSQLGMGLLIVRRIAELHQGAFSIQSQYQQWTVVEVQFLLKQ